MRFELTTLTLARLCSTPELRPHKPANHIQGREGARRSEAHYIARPPECKRIFFNAFLSPPADGTVI